MTGNQKEPPRGMSPQCHGHHCGRRPSSFRIQDPDLVFRELALRPGEVMIDLGCGVGDYSMIAAGMVAPSGLVYAVDRLEDAVAEVEERARREGAADLRAVVADITRPLPFGDGVVDVCFLCTVLHSIRGEEERARVFYEIYRVLKPGGRCVVVECRKDRTSFGPPPEMRLSCEDIDRVAFPAGFSRLATADFGETYLVSYGR